MGKKIWSNAEEKVVVESVLGSEATEYFHWAVSNRVLSEFSASNGDLGVQEDLSKIVEGSDWSYAIYWHVSRAKSGKSALIWGDGHFQESKEGQDDKFGGDRRKWVLRKLHACFGGFEDDYIASKLDRVSNVEMFYLTSMFFAFPFDKPSVPSQSFNSDRCIWISNMDSSLEKYQSRAYLAQFETRGGIYIFQQSLKLYQKTRTSIIKSSKSIYRL